MQTILTKSKTDAFNNMSLEETLKWIEKISCFTATEIDFLKTFHLVDSEEIEKLLNEETIKRYKGLVLSLKFPYENYKVLPNDSNKEILEQSLLVQSWSLLGSLLESTLQMFLSFYYSDYIKSDWNVWNTKAINEIKDVLTGSFKEQLEDIVKQNVSNSGTGLTTNIKNSFLDKAKDILKQKSNIPSIEKVMLSDLINLYFSEGILQRDDYNKVDLETIRDYRNGIHNFQERVIGSWDEYNNYLKAVIMLIIDISYHLPSIPDEEPIPYWYEEKSEIIMQENVWLDYRLGVDHD